MKIDSKSRMNVTRLRIRALLIGFAACLCVAATPTFNFFAQDIPAIYKTEEKPADVRLQPLKDLNGYFPFDPPTDQQSWLQRAEVVRNQLRVALGLHPMPTKSPLNAVIHGRNEEEDYTVERVYFESLPGFFVTGNLYRPKNATGKSPGILCPHGHWSNGRFYDAGDAEAKRQIESGAEKFDAAAHSPLQARCVHLARMGCVVFHYDMIGYADSVQISSEIAHGFKKQRPEMNAAKNWGLFSPQAESHLQSVMGLQTLSSIRSLDFLESLADVDPKRLAVTGGSGGGTQTMLLAAIDSRVTTAFPAVMVSTSMQGGCTCENCSLLRINTGNVEFAALFAPKPQGMSAANDWTKEMESKGFPELKQLYALLDAQDKVSLVARTEFNHNYNLHSRLAMYRLFNDVFNLNADLQERDFNRLTTAQMTVWNDEHPEPKSGDEFERQLLADLHQDCQQQVDAMIPADKAGFDRFRDFQDNAIAGLVGRDPNQELDLNWELADKIKLGDTLLMTGKLQNRTHGEELPILFLHPADWNGEVVVWTSETGKKHLLDDTGKPIAAVTQLLESGFSIAGVDLLMQGEFLGEGEQLEQTRKVENPREAAAYTFGYNHSLLVRRVHDVMTVVKFSRTYEKSPAKKVHLVAIDETAPVAAVALAVLRQQVDSAILNTDGFRFDAVTDIHDPYFMPGGAKYLDLPGFLATAAPIEIHVDSSAKTKVLTAAYDSVDAAKSLHFDTLDPKAVTTILAESQATRSK